MKNLRQSIKFRDCMVKFCFATLSTFFSSLNLDSVYLSSGILYGMTDNLSIHSYLLLFQRFLVNGFINRLVKNLLILYLIVFQFAKK